MDAGPELTPVHPTSTADESIRPHSYMRALSNHRAAVQPAASSLPNQHGNHRYVASECRSQFNPDKVVRVVQTAPTSGILHFQPLQPNDREKNIAVSNALVDRLPEVTSRLDSRNIHKYRIVAELRHQVVEQATCLALRIVSPIVDENGTQSGPPEVPAPVIREENYPPQKLIIRKNGELECTPVLRRNSNIHLDLSSGCASSDTPV